MQRIFILLSLLQFGWNGSAQNFYLKISATSTIENRTIDSIGYNSKHPNTKSIIDETQIFSEKLTRLGFIENEIVAYEKINDSTFLCPMRLGKKTDFIHIYVGQNSALASLQLANNSNDTLTIPFNETESFLNQTLSKLERKGYSLAKLKLINFKKNKQALVAELFIDPGKKRQLNDIVIKGYDKFPEGHKKNVRRLYKNTLFNQEILKKIHSDFEKFRFTNQTKYPEILFTKDTTKVYVYLEKSKPNKFDGFIGFSNDKKNNFTLNGYLDLLLVNNLNAGEALTLYWKSNGNEQKTFNIGIELPYLFKSPLGLKANLNIFKQDSTFQNTKTAIDIGYFFNYNTRMYLGYQATASSDIQNLNNSSLNDFTNSFWTSHFELVNFKNDDVLFPEKTKIDLKFGIGARNSNLSLNQQTFINADLKQVFLLDEKNSINIRSQNYYLQSNHYIVNELARFGGINSIRGFNENSLPAHLFTSLLTEYRYKMASTLYINTIIDYGHFKDQTTTSSGNLLGLGFGMGLLTKNGIFNLVYATGSINDQAIKPSNAIVHISFKSSF